MPRHVQKFKNFSSQTSLRSRIEFNQLNWQVSWLIVLFTLHPSQFLSGFSWISSLFTVAGAAEDFNLFPS